MKKIICILLLIFIATISLKAQTWQYVQSFGGQYGNATNTPLGNNNRPSNLVLDDNGNAYLYGTYGNLMQLGDSILPYFIDNTRGTFITKFNCNGNFEWVKSIAHSEQMQNQADYMIMKDDFLYLSGTVRVDTYYKTCFLDTLVIGSILMEDYPDNCTFPWVPYNRYTYLIKMDLDGNIIDYHLFTLYNDDITKFSNLWELWYNGYNQRAFTIDGEGNYYLFAGLYSNQTSVVYCDNQAVSDTITVEVEKAPYYLLKFDPDFNLLWYKSIAHGISDSDNYTTIMDFLDMACDSQNNLYMVGYLQTNNTLGTETYPVEIDLGNEQHLETYINNNAVGFLLKMNSEGEVQWTQQSKGYTYDGLNSNCVFESIVLDEETNNIYVGGYAVPVRTNGPNTGTIFGDIDTLVAYYPNAISISGIIANYDIDGNYHWIRAPYGRYSRVSSLALHNNLLYAGVRWNVELSHGEEYYSYPVGTGGFTVCTWDTEGNQIGSIPVTSTCSGLDKLYAYDTRVNSWGEIFTTGTYDYGLTFGDHYIHGGGFKMFIAKYGNLCPFINEQTANFCYGTEYNGTVLTQSGDYQFVLESSTPEVDSVINLHATVYPQLTTGINDTTLCANETHILEANSGYNSYSWSAGSNTNNQELNYSAVGIENVYVTLTDDNCTAVDTIVITVEICGLTTQNPLNSISLYPVPANAHISVKLANNEKITAYSVFNLQGQLIKTESVNSNDNFGFSVTDFTPGQYIIYVKTENGIYSGGFVKE